jgi:REP element-mobilizing transposase RayT
MCAARTDGKYRHLSDVLWTGLPYSDERTTAPAVNRRATPPRQRGWVAATSRVHPACRGLAPSVSRRGDGGEPVSSTSTSGFQSYLGGTQKCHSGSSYYHVVWSTKNRAPVLTEANEPIIYDFIRDKARELGGIVFAINGMADHAHLVAAVPPRLAVATFIGQVKGASPAMYNKGRGGDQPHFAWQSEYGVLLDDTEWRRELLAILPQTLPERS